jgi:hypothetical protein
MSRIQPVDDVGALSWHREYRPGGRKRVVTAVKAWAHRLDPDAAMPPYYRIVRAYSNSTRRVVYLMNCRTCGGDKIEVGIASNLVAAKSLAGIDYAARYAEQSLTSPS